MASAALIPNVNVPVPGVVQNRGSNVVMMPVAEREKPFSLLVELVPEAGCRVTTVWIS